MKITVVSGEITTYEGPETSLKLRVYPKHTFISSTEEVIPRSHVRSEHFYLEIPCTVTNGVVTFDAFIIDSTLDAISDPNRTSYSFALFNDDEEHIQTIYTGIRVPLSTPTTLPALVLYSSTTPAVLPDTYYTDVEVDNLIAAALSALTGDVVEILDPEWVALTETKYLEEYVSLAAAIAAIGATPTDLKITSNVAVPATATIPATTRVIFEGNGKLTIASGQTLTIGLMADPGNKQVFAQADATANLRFSVGAVERMNIAWLLGPTATLCTNALNQYLANATANSGGRIYIPEGTWTTAGGHALPSNTTIEGVGVSSNPIATTTLKLSVASSNMFTVGNSRSSIVFRNLTLDGDNGGATIGLLCTDSGVNPAAFNVAFEGVHVTGFVTGVRVWSTASDWQMAALSFDSACVFSDNSHSAIRCNSANCGINVAAYITVPGAGYGLYLEKCGVVNYFGVEFAGSAYSGDNQVMSQTVVAGAGITSNGNAKSVITADGMPGSPATVYVPVNTTDHTTPALIAAAFRDALANDESVGYHFRVAGTGADVQLIKLDAEANDATMNFTIEDDTSAGITDDVTATATTAGSSDSAMATAAVYVGGSHAEINFFGTQDEGFANSLVNDSSDLNSQITFYGCIVQSAIRLNQSCKLCIIGSVLGDRIIRDGVGSSQYMGFGNSVQPVWYSALGIAYTPVSRVSNITGVTGGGGSLMMFDVTNTSPIRATFGIPTRFYHNQTLFSLDPDDPFVEILSSQTKKLLRLGRCTEPGIPDFYYDFERDNVGTGTAGRLLITGNQTGSKGYDLDADIYATGAIRGGAAALTDGATITIDPKDGNAFHVTLEGNRTLAMTVLTDIADEYQKTRADGQIITVEVTQDVVGTRTLTLGTGAGQFAFSTTIPSITLSVTASQVDLLTFRYSKRLDRWMVIGFDEALA